jgi:hypothetical protein
MHNTTVAKLLAKENIEVQYGNYNTAWFDIQSRTLGLPLWKDMGKDVHDLLVGHEVGHALYTPYEGWHDTPEKLEGCPRSYINVVEDARIEKMIRRAYPGLVGPMSRGYKKLSTEEFFGDISNPDWDQIKLIDKINLKAKLNTLIDVPFNTEEATLFNKTMNTETFEEVLEVVKEILSYTQDNTPELIQQPEVDESSSSTDETESSSQEDVESSTSDLPQGHDDYEKPQGDSSDQEDSSEKTEENDSKESQEQEGDSSTDKTEEETSGEGTVKASKTPDSKKDADISITDVLYRSSEERLLDTNQFGQQTIVARDRGKKTITSTTIPYSILREKRAKKWSEQEDFVVESHKDILNDYPKYLKSVKKSVNVAVKEFEMKKAAFQWQRAASAKTGVLDTNSLHQYKTHDDIFKRVTNLADAKNHGMIMLIDYSGSMASTLPQVLDQLIHLVTFCKSVNIPFDVYAFTTTWKSDPISLYKAKDGEIDFDDISMPQLISSSLSKAHYEEALQQLYIRKITCAARYSYDYDKWYSDDAVIAPEEDFGGTPLNAALVTSHHLVKQFVKKHGVQKMNLVVLSDGDSNALQVVRDHKLRDHHADTVSSYEGKIDAIVDGKKIKIQGRRIGATKALLDNLKSRYGVTTLGFFIAQDSRDWKGKISQISGQEWIDTSSPIYKDFQRQYQKNKVAVVNNTLGYDKFFLLKPGKQLEAENQEFSETDTGDMTTSQIRNSFKKYSKNKRNNKVLMKQLGGVVA